MEAAYTIFNNTNTETRTGKKKEKEKKTSGNAREREKLNGSFSPLHYSKKIPFGS